MWAGCGWPPRRCGAFWLTHPCAARTAADTTAAPHAVAALAGLGTEQDLDLGVTHFGQARRCVFAIVDMVSRYWITSLVSTEETSTQVRVIFDQALLAQDLDELEPPRSRHRRPRPADPARRVRQRPGHDLRHPRLHGDDGHRPTPRPTPHPHRPSLDRESSGTSSTNGPTSTRSPTRRCSTQSWHASGSTTTKSGCTKRSATSPPTTNTTNEENRSARPAGSNEPAHDGSTTTAGPPPTTPRTQHESISQPISAEDSDTPHSSSRSVTQ